MNKITIFLLLIVFCACNEQGQNKVSSTDSPNVPNVVVKSSPGIKSASGVLKSSVSDSGENFIIFWQTFRKEVLKSDLKQIKSLTAFPVECRGPFDDDPVVKISNEQFGSLFSLFLKQWHGDLEGSTEFDFIQKDEQPYGTEC